MFNALKLLLFSIILVFAINCNLQAQNNVLNTKLTIKLKNTSPKQIIEYIDSVYQINFYYNDNFFPTAPIKQVDFIDATLDEFLIKYFSDYNVGYKQVNNSIVFFEQKKVLTEISISGTVIDYETGESLIGVTVYDKHSKMATITNNYGFYSFKLKQGVHDLSVSYVGYLAVDTALEVTDNLKLNIALKTSDVLLGEVKVQARQDGSIINTTQMNTSTLYMNDIRLIPGMFGENDVVRNLAILPGIQQGDMMEGGVYVRGGSSDQTIFLMDEATIYNPSHFGGLFSVFNPDIVKTVQIYKGDMPVTDHGAISSAINVHLRDGNNQKWKTKGSLGLISVKGLVEGPLVKDKSSVLVSFRRSYIDLFLKMPSIEIEPELNYHFYDLNFKYNHKLNSKNRIYVSGYSGTDDLQIGNYLVRTNQMANVRWNHTFNNNTFSNTSFVLSRNYLEQNGEDAGTRIMWSRYVYNYLLKHNINYYPWRNTIVKTGFSLNGYDINPFRIKTLDSRNFSKQSAEMNEYLIVAGAYGSIVSTYGDRISYDAGLRINYNFNPRADLHTGASGFVEDASGKTDDTYWSVALEPRIKLNYLLSQKLALKCSYNRLTNALHQLKVTETGIAINRWMPATKGFKPQISNNFSAGLYNTLTKSITLEFEGYYRRMNNLVETLHNSNILVNENPDKYLYNSKGKAYGIESSVKLNYNRFSAFVNYTYARALWHTKNLNNNHWYSAFQDRPHSLNISLSKKILKRLTLSANWIYYTGTPFTNVNGKYWLDGKTMVNYDISNINGSRLPNYHRLDLSLDIEGRKNYKRKWKSFWNFSIYNAYFHDNPYTVMLFSPVDELADESPYHFEPKYMYFYQFVPSVTYKFDF